MALLMKCGHVANAEHVLKDGSRAPVCVICVGIHEGAEIVERKCKGTDGLEVRKARCVYSQPKRGYTCQGEVDSKWELPFFEHRPDQDHDKYYCGCWGWD